MLFEERTRIKPNIKRLFPKAQMRQPIQFHFMVFQKKFDAKIGFGCSLGSRWQHQRYENIGADVTESQLGKTGENAAAKQKIARPCTISD